MCPNIKIIYGSELTENYSRPPVNFSTSLFVREYVSPVSKTKSEHLTTTESQYSQPPQSLKYTFFHYTYETSQSQHQMTLQTHFYVFDVCHQNYLRHNESSQSASTFIEIVESTPGSMFQMSWTTAYPPRRVVRSAN